jgi:hypothetical protein
MPTGRQAPGLPQDLYRPTGTAHIPEMPSAEMGENGSRPTGQHRRHPPQARKRPDAVEPASHAHVADGSRLRQYQIRRAARWRRPRAASRQATASRPLPPGPSQRPSHPNCIKFPACLTGNLMQFGWGGARAGGPGALGSGHSRNPDGSGRACGALVVPPQCPNSRVCANSVGTALWAPVSLGVAPPGTTPWAALLDVVGGRLGALARVLLRD